MDEKKEFVTPEEEEDDRDIVTFADDEGNEFELEVIEYFDYEDEEYAILMDTAEPAAEEEESEVYIMKVVVNGEMEEFVPADDDKMDALIQEVEKIFAEWDDEDCCCEDDDCDCGCHHHED